jgi:CRP-like cAMP-binding protein
MASAPREVWGDLATSAFVEASLLFRSLDPEARQDLLRVAQVSTWQAGELVSDVGGDDFVLVVDGAAAVRVGSAGGPVEVGHVERGGFFGAEHLLGSARGWSLEARTEVTAVVFPLGMITALDARFPKVRRLLEVVLAAREKEATERAGAVA